MVGPRPPGGPQRCSRKRLHSDARRSSRRLDPAFARALFPFFLLHCAFHKTFPLLSDSLLPQAGMPMPHSSQTDPLIDGRARPPGGPQRCSRNRPHSDAKRSSRRLDPAFARVLSLFTFSFCNFTFFVSPLPSPAHVFHFPIFPSPGRYPGFSACRSSGIKSPSFRTSSPSSQISPPPESGR